jgi:hypothetical protein
MAWIEIRTMTKPVRISSVECLGGFTVLLGMTNGKSKVVDLAPLMRGPIFEALRTDPALFTSIRVDARAGTIVWPNGADIDPDVLCQGLTPTWDEMPNGATIAH